MGGVIAGITDRSVLQLSARDRRIRGDVGPSNKAATSAWDYVGDRELLRGCPRLIAAAAHGVPARCVPLLALQPSRLLPLLHGVIDRCA